MWSEWQHEEVVFLFPEVRQTRRWEGWTSGVLAIHAATYDRVEVYHVHPHGLVFGPSLGRFRNDRIDGLLQRWLNPPAHGFVELLPGCDRLRMTFPDPDYPDTDTMHLRGCTLHLGPKGMMTLQSFDRESGSVLFQAPPDGCPLPTVSPDEESHAVYGPFNFESIAGAIPIYRSTRDPQVAVGHFRFRWEEPFTDLIALSSGVDPLFHQAKMKTIASLSDTDLPGALDAARTESANYVFEGDALDMHVFVLPVLRAFGEEAAVAAAEERYGFTANDFESMKSQRQWQQLAKRTIPVRRAWGAIGLMWALLIDVLEAGTRLGPCQSCDRLIEKGHGRRYCRQEDNPACHKRRNRRRKAESRSGGSRPRAR
jgi:hypothetical protein